MGTTTKIRQGAQNKLIKIKMTSSIEYECQKLCVNQDVLFYNNLLTCSTNKNWKKINMWVHENFNFLIKNVNIKLI